MHSTAFEVCYIRDAICAGSGPHIFSSEEDIPEGLFTWYAWSSVPCGLCVRLPAPCARLKRASRCHDLTCTQGCGSGYVHKLLKLTQQSNNPIFERKDRRPRTHDHVPLSSGGVPCFALLCCVVSSMLSLHPFPQLKRSTNSLESPHKVNAFAVHEC